MPVTYSRYWGLLLLACCCCSKGNGQEPPAARIPDSIARGAGMVIRLDATDIDIESPRKARIRRKYCYTILNASGDQYATIHTFYDKFHNLVNATGILYDAGGRVLKKIRKGEMEDWSTAGSGILMTDTRVKFYHFSCRNYPYSVSFEEETELNGLFFLPEWLAIKLVFVFFLYIYFYSLHKIFKQQLKGIFKYSSQQLRIWNEVATIFLVAIVMLAVVKQGISVVWGLVGLVLFVALLMSAIKIYKLMRK